MHVIGVVDLLAGRAVHATGGVREAYRPVETVAGFPIDGDPAVLAAAYVERLGVPELYVADLDAIRGAPLQEAAVAALASAALAWVDAGVSSPADGRRVADLGAGRVVIGLETLVSLDALSRICEAVGRDRTAFSLDVRQGRPVVMSTDLAGEPAHAIAARAAEAGIGAIILLDLDRVGADGGPDLDRVARVRSAAQDPMLLVGGGIRDAGDVRALAGVGCDGVLLATALHRGRIDAAAVASILRLEGHRSTSR